MAKALTQQQWDDLEDLETRFDRLHDACACYHRDAWEALKENPKRVAIWQAIEVLLRNANYLAGMGKRVKGVGIADARALKAEMFGRARTLRDIGIITAEETHDWLGLANVAAELAEFNIRTKGGR